jgi:hypothetical protein
MTLVNLYDETCEVLSKNDASFDDVKYVALGDGKWTNVSKFIEIAKEITYDNGYGGVEINFDLQVVGKDFWLQRVEYDGSEEWQFLRHPGEPKEELYKKDTTGLDIAEVYGEIHSLFLKNDEMVDREKIQRELYEQDLSYISEFIPEYSLEYTSEYPWIEEDYRYPDDEYDYFENYSESDYFPVIDDED